jgi:hypothetical protein
MLSILLRRLGKVLASCNAIWIIALCFLQFANAFDNCYCGSSVLGLGDKAYNVIEMTREDILRVRGPWIGGVIVSVGTAAFFIGFTSLFAVPQPRRPY